MPDKHPLKRPLKRASPKNFEHFDKIASANRAALKAAPADQAERFGYVTGVYEVIVQQARMFKTFDSQFNATLFITASVEPDAEDYIVERLVERAVY